MVAAMPPPPGTIEPADPTSVVRRSRGHWSGCSAWSRTAALLSCPLGGADTIAAETCEVRATGANTETREVRATDANAPSNGERGPPAVGDEPGANPRTAGSSGATDPSTIVVA